MGDGHRPAPPTASLLARKGSAAPSFTTQQFSVVPAPDSARPEDQSAAAPDIDGQVRRSSTLRPRVVVVAADMLGRKLLRALVAAHGCEVAMFGPSESPIAHVLRSRPDLVVIDLDVGQVAARDLSIRIKGDPQLRATSVVAVTDPATPSVLGYDALLAKPLSANDVARTLGRLARLRAPLA